jgi:hypothetical protein
VPGFAAAAAVDFCEEDRMTFILSEPGASLPPDYERRLANGALVIFGDNMPEALAALKAQGSLEDRTTVAAIYADELALPRTLMLWVLLIFQHSMPGIKGRGPTQEEREHWRDKLLDRLTWIEGSEPLPQVKFLFEQQTPGVTLQLTWSGNDVPNWQGVNSSQIKRIAIALDERYRLALKRSSA